MENQSTHTTMENQSTHTTMENQHTPENQPEQQVVTAAADSLDRPLLSEEWGKTRTEQTHTDRGRERLNLILQVISVVIALATLVTTFVSLTGPPLFDSKTEVAVFIGICIASLVFSLVMLWCCCWRHIDYVESILA